MGDAADDFVCVETPEPFLAVGRFYTDFDQTTDEEVVRCLRTAAMRTNLAENVRSASDGS
jgi:putative phosphoribosyl transferase